MDVQILNRLNSLKEDTPSKTYKETLIMPKAQGEPQILIEKFAKRESNGITMMRTGKFNELSSNAMDINGLNTIRVSSDASPIIRSGDNEQIIRVSPLDEEAIYIREGIINQWVNRLTGYHLAARPTITCSEEWEQEITDKILSPTKIRRIFKKIFNHLYTFGNAILRWYNLNNKPVGITWIDPKQFDVIKNHCEYDVKITQELYKRCKECNLL